MRIVLYWLWVPSVIRVYDTMQELNKACNATQLSTSKFLINVEATDQQ
jgi:hypothetical protein